MRRIIYTSISLTGTDLAELDAIVTESIASNTKAGITGMLWSNGANFAQVLEGGHDEVGATMDRIRADPRHVDIEVVLDRAVVSRQFGNWAMRRADDGEASTPGTTFLLGFALSERTASAKRLYEIIMAIEG
ncbi:BLUF domain-containing protein [Sphingomonas sp. PAMC 26605]|uniref:BLUF domain-containing protein n=1 Tax=Sphingomonas sp. PAMC 26605 TaxID=1112214 RepID=UPI00026CD1ED|nr:BLUF domain-containing protein [Sphingomonas sp. PAMC 26605]